MSKNGTHFNDQARLQKYTSAIRSCIQPQDAMTEGRDEKKKKKGENGLHNTRGAMKLDSPRLGDSLTGMKSRRNLFCTRTRTQFH